MGGSRLLLAMPLILGLLVLVPEANAATLVVNQSANCTVGSSYYSTITSAMAAAADGDTIIACQGAYTENIDVNVAVNIRSYSQTPANTIVNASNPNDHAFNVTANSVNISGFTVKGATAAGEIAGIYLNSVSNCNISNNNATSNYKGILVWSSGNNIISNNTAYSNEYVGIQMKSSSNYNNVSNNFVSTSISSERGICMDAGSSNNIILNNTISNISGMAINVGLNSNSNTIKYNNITDSGWGVYLNTVTGTTIANNTISTTTNAIRVYSSSGSTIVNNTLQNNSYGFFYFYTSGSNTIYNNWLNNTNNSEFDASISNNAWNVTKTSGTNIVGGPYLGGNFWAYPNGTGFSETCNDIDSDGICDIPYNLAPTNIDYLPLAKVMGQDFTPPTITIISPQNGTTTADNTPLLNATFGGEVVNATWFNPDDTTNSTPAWNTSNLTLSLSPLMDGMHKVTVYANDTAGNLNFSVAYFTVHTIPPAITFVPPTDPNGTTTNRNWTYISIVLSEPGTAWLEWNGANETMSNSTATNWYRNKTALSDGTYNYRVWANDTLGNLNVSETRTIVVDTVRPTITSTSPSANETNVLVSLRSINITFSEPILPANNSAISTRLFVYKNGIDYTYMVASSFSSVGGNKYQLTLFNYDLDVGTVYTVVAAGFQDAAGNVMSPTSYSWNFTTIGVGGGGGVNNIWIDKDNTGTACDPPGGTAVAALWYCNNSYVYSGPGSYYIGVWMQQTGTAWVYRDGSLVGNISAVSAAPYWTDVTYLSPGQHYIRVIHTAGDDITWYINVSAAEQAGFQDTDADGLDDYWEGEWLWTLSYSGSDDPDGDGYDNMAEFYGFSDPLDPFSTPAAIGPPPEFQKENFSWWAAKNANITIANHTANNATMNVALWNGSDNLNVRVNLSTGMLCYGGGPGPLGEHFYGLEFDLVNTSNASQIVGHIGGGFPWTNGSPIATNTRYLNFTSEDGGAGGMIFQNDYGTPFAIAEPSLTGNWSVILQNMSPDMSVPGACFSFNVTSANLTAFINQLPAVEFDIYALGWDFAGNVTFGAGVNLSNFENFGNITFGDGAMIYGTPYMHNGTVIPNGSVIGANMTYFGKIIGGERCTFGGAFVGDGAFFDPFVTMKLGARVEGNATVGQNATIGNFTRIGNFTTIGAMVTIDPFVIIKESARILQGARVYENATIEAGAEIKNNSVVGKFAMIFGNASLGLSVKTHDNVTIGANATIKDFAVVGNRSFIGNKVVVGQYATIHNDAEVWNNSVIGNRSEIGASAKVYQVTFFDYVDVGPNVTVNYTIADNSTINFTLNSLNFSNEFVNVTKVIINSQGYASNKAGVNGTISLAEGGVRVNFTSIYESTYVHDLILNTNRSLNITLANGTAATVFNNTDVGASVWFNATGNLSGVNMSGAATKINPGGVTLPSKAQNSNFTNLAAPGANQSNINARLCMKIPGGIDSGTVKLNYFNETSGAWEELTTAINGTEACANTTHFSVYGMSGSVYGGGGSVYGVKGSHIAPKFDPIARLTVVSVTSKTLGEIIDYFASVKYAQFHDVSAVTGGDKFSFAGALISAGEYPDLGKFGVTAAKPVSKAAGNLYKLSSEKVIAKFFHTEEVVVARGDLAVDSLAAIAYAKSKGAPILLTRPGELPGETLAAVKKLGPLRVIIAGGAKAVSPGVEAELGRLAAVSRRQGETRYETAVELARATGSPRTIVIASGADPREDAMIVSASYKAPLIYVGALEVPASVETYLKENKGVKIIYGAGVSEEVKAKVSSIVE